MSPLVLEPHLDEIEIQGNILVTFNKPCQGVVPLYFDGADAENVKIWLSGVSPQVTSTRQILLLRDKLRQARALGAPLDPASTPIWLNLSFSFQGLTKLTSEAEQFRDARFRGGLPLASARLRDPIGDDPGAPATWKFGGPGDEPDALAVIAGDSVARVEEHVAAFIATAETQGLTVKSPEIGKDLSLQGGAPQTEHFGFKDGISQPGVRGFWRGFPQRHVTARKTPPPTDIVSVAFAEPGKPLICPGEFVLGYPRQSDAFGSVPAPAYPLEAEAGSIAPEWARNGSFLVYRRLRQDVAAFQDFLAQQSMALQAEGETSMTDALLGAMFVGRWKSGAPIIKHPDADPGPIDDLQDFGFVDDFGARKCPAASHIRKVNPRDLTTEQGGGVVRTLIHRMLRRGIPYGPTYDADKPEAEPVDRGLLFLAYQANIGEQFEFVTSNWANAKRRPHTPDSNWGQDMVIGRGPRNEGGKRFFVFDRETRRTVDTSSASVMDWVRPTGGGYFFTPSISAIREVLSA